MAMVDLSWCIWSTYPTVSNKRSRRFYDQVAITTNMFHDWRTSVNPTTFSSSSSPALRRKPGLRAPPKRGRIPSLGYYATKVAYNIYIYIIAVAQTEAFQKGSHCTTTATAIRKSEKEFPPLIVIEEKSFDCCQCPSLVVRRQSKEYYYLTPKLWLCAKR